MNTNTATQEKQSIIHNTFVLERHFPQPPHRVFAAFADPAKKRKWFGDGNQHEVEQFDVDFRPGGSEHLRYRMKPGTPIAGMIITNRGAYLVIVPDERIVAAYTMALNETPFSASLLTIELAPSDGGTNLICTHQGAYFEGADGPEMRQAGWRSLFDKLAQALESE